MAINHCVNLGEGKGGRVPGTLSLFLGTIKVSYFTLKIFIKASEVCPADYFLRKEKILFLKESIPV